MNLNSIQEAANKGSQLIIISNDREFVKVAQIDMHLPDDIDEGKIVALLHTAAELLGVKDPIYVACDADSAISSFRIIRRRVPTPCEIV